jgi:hypothetical protein
VEPGSLSWQNLAPHRELGLVIERVERGFLARLVPVVPRFQLVTWRATRLSFVIAAAFFYMCA